MAETQATPLASIALRGGGTLDVWRDRIVAQGTIYWMSELTGAAQMNDPAAPRGVAPAPAVGLRGRDSAWMTYVAADPPDALRALRAIYSVRPELTGAFVTTPPGAQIPPMDPGAVTREQAVLAGIAHLSVFFAPFLVPLIIWLAFQPTAPYAGRQAKQAFFFHLLTTAIGIGLGIVLFVIFFVSVMIGASTGDSRWATPGLIVLPLIIILSIALGVFALGFAIYGAVQTFQGRPFHYPLLGRL